VISSWVKFNSYSCSAMRVPGSTAGPLLYLQPSPKAKPERYDPYAKFRALREKSADAAAPYRELLDLAALSGTRAADAAAAWCAEWGLLGLLLHRTIRVTLARRDASARFFSAMARRPAQEVPEDAGISGVVTLHHVGARWIEGPVSVHGTALAGVSLEEYARRMGVGAWLRPLGSSLPAQKQEPLAFHPDSVGVASAWLRYFPTIPASPTGHDHPLPTDGERFWRSYAEPLEDFLEAAAFLGRCWTGVSERLPDGRGLRALDPLLDRVELGLALNEDGRSVREIRRTSSLLGALGLMELDDAVGGLRTVHCRYPACGKRLDATRLQDYCSEAHRKNDETRRRRQDPAKRDADNARRKKLRKKKAKETKP
jgi:hypothetical protein